MDEVPLDELLAQRRKPAAHRHPTRQHHDAVPLAERDRGESQRADIRRERRLPPYLAEYGLVRVRVRIRVTVRVRVRVRVTWKRRGDMRKRPSGRVRVRDRHLRAVRDAAHPNPNLDPHPNPSLNPSRNPHPHPHPDPNSNPKPTL